jgi:deoxyribodipyrimidine photolyase
MPTPNTFILSVTDFENVIDLNNNIAQNRLKQVFGRVQEPALLPIICREFYNELIEEIETNTLTTANEILLPYIKDFLIYKSMARYYATANYKSTPAGIRVHTDTISSQANPDQMRQLIDMVNKDASFYQDELVNFLQANQDDYPTWRDSSCGNCNNFSKASANIRFGANRSTKTKINWT